MQADMQVRQQEAQTQAMLEEQKMTFERQKFSADLEMRQREMQSKRDIELLKLGARDSENGPVVKEDDRHAQMLETLKETIGALAQGQSKAKRVIRDENGDVVGVETVN